MNYQNEISKEKLTNLLCVSRANAGVTQETMAMELGVARKTIQNWEKGITFPDMIQTIHWFEVLNVNPLSFIFQYRYPEMASSKYATSEQVLNVKDALHSLIELLPEDGLERLLYLFYGDHGSDPKGLMHILNAYIQMPMKNRVVQAAAIMKGYEIAKGTNTLTSEEGVQPDMDFLYHIMESCEEAVMRDKQTFRVNYTADKKE